MPSSFYAKIDDRGRITLAKGAFYSCETVGFSADIKKRIVHIFRGGRYPVDSRRRVFVPADIRRSLGLAAGSYVNIIERGVA